MTEVIIRDVRASMQLVLDALTDQLQTLHIGRASSGMVENLTVEYYGSTMPMKQVGSITIPEANQILITPWDKGALAPIEKAIRESDLGLNPVNDGKAVRIMLPPMTEERRLELAKVISKMAEEARIALRNERHTGWDKAQSSQKNGDITEDDRDRARTELDKLIDQMNQEVERVAKAKEHEVVTI